MVRRFLQKYYAKIYKYTQKTAYQIISSITKNNELKQILLSQCGDYFPLTAF